MAAAGLVNIVPSVTATPEPFVPDIVFDSTHPLARHVDVYLDGVKQMKCFEARVKWESFDSPMFGELVAASNDEWSSVYQRPAQSGEFERDKIWVRIVCGQVEIKMTEKGRAIYAEMKQ